MIIIHHLDAVHYQNAMAIAGPVATPSLSFDRIAAKV